MNTDIEIYKTNRIAELNKIYNNNYNIIIANYINVYKQIINNRFYLNKQQTLNNLTASTNKQLFDLKANLNLSISKIQNLVISLPQVTNKKNALLIGINYIGTSNELSGCINDVDAMEKMLIKTGSYENYFTIEFLPLN
jgi:hypothetical protein